MSPRSRDGRRGFREVRDACGGADEDRELPDPEGLPPEAGRACAGDRKGCFFGELDAAPRPEGAPEKPRGERAQARFLSRDGEGEQPCGNGGPSSPSAYREAKLKRRLSLHSPEASVYSLLCARGGLPTSASKAQARRTGVGARGWP